MDDIDGGPGASRAGLLLARLTVAPVLLLVSWLVVGLPLLMAGVFRPWAAIPLFVVVAGPVLTFGLRAVRPAGSRAGSPGGRWRACSRSRWRSARCSW
ncbi:hypothetical protein [Actinoallomurus acanthiterrae]